MCKVIMKEVVEYLTENPYSYETVEGLSMKIGRKEKDLEIVLEELVSANIITEKGSSHHPVYTLSKQTEHFQLQFSEVYTFCPRQYINNSDVLTKREKEVAILLLEDHSNLDIARLLFISQHTLKNHITKIYRKFGCMDRAHFVSLLYQQALEQKKIS
ncbi:helix-turn-helix transcriptional regulator [Bacillus sp. BGMRC 2118]|nr:helix-turn-helix transcriptional regulator [Bacillus sp. BGMRC 2118]